ncbi:hypothetical protein ABPG75_001944 [Micractinium tetrahymenae]
MLMLPHPSPSSLPAGPGRGLSQLCVGAAARGLGGAPRPPLLPSLLRQHRHRWVARTSSQPPALLARWPTCPLARLRSAGSGACCSEQSPGRRGIMCGVASVQLCVSCCPVVKRPLCSSAAAGIKTWERPEASACALIKTTQTSHEQPSAMRPRKNGEGSEGVAAQA